MLGASGDLNASSVGSEPGETCTALGVFNSRSAHLAITNGRVTVSRQAVNAISTTAIGVRTSRPGYSLRLDSATASTSLLTPPYGVGALSVTFSKVPQAEDETTRATTSNGVRRKAGIARRDMAGE